MQQSLSDRLVAFLQENGAHFRSMHHDAVQTSEEAAAIRGTPLEQGAFASES